MLVLLADEDLTPREVAAEVSREPTTDELHRTIRRFRRGQAQRYSIASLLGSSSAMQKVRSQVEAAAASGANTLIVGPRGSGRSHAARAIHYENVGDEEAVLVAVDCEPLTDDLWERSLEKLRPTRSEGRKHTLLLQNLESLAASYQKRLLSALNKNGIDARIIATIDFDRTTDSATETSAIRTDGSAVVGQKRNSDGPPEVRTVDRQLIDAISTITIRMPRLVDRPEDLPLLAQYFLEQCNRSNSKQVGSIRPEALDLLALYSWPGELDQLHDTIAAAHETCISHAVAANDLPAVFRHAFRAAAHLRPQPERIVLDELLAAIEKEAIGRAMAQAGGNKSEAAVLLGMTRPRLYRRLIHLGLVREDAAGEDAAAEDAAAVEPAESPEFIEQDAAEPGE